ncbi:AAA family ATPase [Pararcticibacter amylolyticus]|uniref:AAA family ATPase n=1 Tax=Pararcticibacter amylolyticus TaxID=2173175 RepID=A0A2U2PHT4_9SPHI|nr:AAA family ATPase [Pararcticibacter amylolyticus]PWG80699.1 AAA family ATPase [Pararcticibacter amylolyticus]
MPYLSEIRYQPVDSSDYPFSIPALRNGLRLSLYSNVAFFVGENGSGKSTVLEGVAEKCGFSLRGGNRNHNLNSGFSFDEYESPLAEFIQLVWKPRRINQGFFMRAESFFNFASYIDEMVKENPNPADGQKLLDAYGGKSLHEQSHGESFLSLFDNKFDSGIYILDEPEAALSPARILAFMSVINKLERSGRAQFLIATHSPILICYPGAAIFHFSESGVTETTYQETEHYNLTKSFLDNPETFLRHLF